MNERPESTGNVAHGFPGTGPFQQLYGADNRLPAGFKGTFAPPASVVVAQPIPFAPVTTHAADEAFRLVLAQGGATAPARDAITAWVAQTVLDGTGSAPGSPDDWPARGCAVHPPAVAPADANANGIPVAWETRRGLDPANCKATGRDLDSRYDNLEVYLNSL